MIEIKVYDWMPSDIIAVTGCFCSCPADLISAVQEGKAVMVRVAQGEELIMYKPPEAEEE